MKSWLLVCMLLQCNSFLSSAQDSSSVNISFISERISLKENDPWIKLQPSSELQFENKKDSLFSGNSFGRRSWRAAKIIFSGEIAVMVFFAAMPESFSNWNKNFYLHPTIHWKNAFTMPPQFDDDPLLVNYIQHPLAGAIYYNGLRSQGASPLHSFLFSCGESTFFEYFIESVAERPSIQDLIVTPIAGSLIGELQNQATTLMKRNGFTFVEKAATFIINPMYVVFNGYKTKRHIYHNL